MPTKLAVSVSDFNTFSSIHSSVQEPVLQCKEAYHCTTATPLYVIFHCIVQYIPLADPPHIKKCLLALWSVIAIVLCKCYKLFPVWAIFWKIYAFGTWLKWRILRKKGKKGPNCFTDQPRWQKISSKFIHSCIDSFNHPLPILSRLFPNHGFSGLKFIGSVQQH